MCNYIFGSFYSYRNFRYIFYFYLQVFLDHVLKSFQQCLFYFVMLTVYATTQVGMIDHIGYQLTVQSQWCQLKNMLSKNISQGKCFWYQKVIFLLRSIRISGYFTEWAHFSPITEISSTIAQLTELAKIITKIHEFLKQILKSEQVTFIYTEI